MLNDHAGRLIEFLHALQRGVGIGDVVVGERFALQLLCGGDGSFFNLFFYRKRPADGCSRRSAYPAF